MIQFSERGRRPGSVVGASQCRRSACSTQLEEGLVAHRGHRLSPQLAAQRLDGTLHRAQADLDAELTRQILTHDVGVATVLPLPLGQPLLMRQQDTRTAADAHRTPTAPTQVHAPCCGYSPVPGAEGVAVPEADLEPGAGWDLPSVRG